jgi:hypothetical protein
LILRDEKMNNKRFEDANMWKAIRIVSSLWPLITSILIVVVAFATMHATLSAHDAAIKQNTAEHIILTDRIARLETAISLIPEMRSDIKLLLSRK